ncbi:dienelactone hydrolase [Diaphorobacter sp. HDW4A]|uniref:alpha/beta hydrolase family protein n=1 Tax=Diaphorobacter sp. HDW4A TaxID=2714924 RepID=UPI001409F8B3|nr:dienelactone hydrolase family protein [Diaphorobacter sp. HDW4A]QIL83271.1 dienelactone hydrolase [Diaphorobacter sp. HDW4A]
MTAYLRPRLALLPLAFAIQGSLPAWASMQERVLQVPVTATNPQGKQVKGHIAVTVYSDPANPVPAPVLVLNHGRSPQAEGRKELHRARFAKQARYFVSRGFLVAVPTRLGYGPTFEDDAEDSGPCKSKRFAPAMNAAATQINAVLAAVRSKRSDALPDRAVIVGQSFGGAASVAAAAQKPEGVQAVINFAGGAGGNPRTHTGKPCEPEQMAKTFQNYGRQSQLPMLWIYARNDQYFGAEWPVKWHAAFQQGGGHAQFKQLPAFGSDGHELFRAGTKQWEPLVSQFLDEVGFPLPLAARIEPALVPAALPASSPDSTASGPATSTDEAAR